MDEQVDDLKAKLAAEEKKMEQVDDLKAKLAAQERKMEDLVSADSKTSAETAAKVALLQEEQTNASNELNTYRSKLDAAENALHAAEADKTRLSTELADKLNTITAKSAEVASLKKSYESLEHEFSRLEAYAETLQTEVDANRKAAESMRGSGGAMQAQQQELLRLNKEAAELSRELQRTERELIKVTDISRRRDGENAGIKSTLESVEKELDSLRQENIEQAKKIGAEAREFKDVQREKDRLQMALQLEQAECARLKQREQETSRYPPQRSSSSTVGRYVVSTLDELLYDSHRWISRYTNSSHSHNHMNGNGSSSNGSHGFSSRAIYFDADVLNTLTVKRDSGADTTSDASVRMRVDRVVTYCSRLRSAFERSVRERETSMDRLSSVLREKEREIKTLEGTLVSVRERAMQMQASSHSQSGPETPLGVGFPRHVNMGGSDDASLSQLQGEIAKERRKLHSLQQEHADLLGLLAQQELEVSILRKVLEGEAGPQTLQQADEKVRQEAMRKYGAYTDYRGDGDDGDDGTDLSVPDMKFTP
jgi:chromosome segregation ATPase